MGVKISWTGWRRESLSIPWLLVSLSGSLTCGHSDDLVCTVNWKITRSHFRLAAFTRWLHTQHVIYEAGWAQTIGGKRAADQCMGETHFIANGLFAVTQTQTQCQAQPLRPVSTTLSAPSSPFVSLCLSSLYQETKNTAGDLKLFPNSVQDKSINHWDMSNLCEC